MEEMSETMTPGGIAVVEQRRAKPKLEPIATKIKPRGERVLVLVEAADDMTEGGIILPDQAQVPPARGIVCAEGPGKTLDSGVVAPMGLPVGTIVYFAKYSGELIVEGKTEFKLLRDHEICASL